MDDSRTLDILREKAALLLQRERSLNELRQRHERVRAWLAALETLSVELSLTEGESVILSRATQTLAQELHFRTATVLSLSIDTMVARVVATAGFRTPPLREATVMLSVQARRQLDVRRPGSCQDADEDNGTGWLGRDLHLSRYMWCPVRVSADETLVLIAGHDQTTARTSTLLAEAEVSYLALMAQHIEAWVRNVRLVADLRSERERLAALNVELEERVIERTSALEQANGELRQNVETLRNTQDQLVVMSRQAGMAEIATGVLHNLGNALNSVNVLAGLLRQRVEDHASRGIEQLARLIDEHRDDWAEFLTQDPRGERVPEYICLLAKHARDESHQLERDMSELDSHIQRARRVLTAQQSFAKHASFLETVRVQDLIEDALRLVDVPLRHACIEVCRDYADDPTLVTDRHHMLEILVNLLSNATDAMGENPTHRRTIVLGLVEFDDGGAELSVQDTGSGIESHMLARIFSHGVTTKPTGHGFGLHISSLSARKLGATLTAESDGPGCGATFRLRLPARSPGATPDQSHDSDDRKSA